MDRTLRLVAISDSDGDAEALSRALSDGGYGPEVRRVRTDSFRGVSVPEPVDIAFFFGGSARSPLLEAVRWLQGPGLDVPLVFVADHGPEDLATAVELLRAGAHDVVFRDHLDTVGDVVERQMSAARARAENRRVARAVQIVANEWRTAVDTVRSPICLVDPKGAVVRCNRAFQRLADRPFAQIVGRDLGTILESTDGGREHPAPAARPVPPDGAHRVVSVRGLTFEVQVEPVREASGNPTGYVHVMNDVTERLRVEAEARRVQTRLAEAQKMEAVGHLAAGIAHDFNNVLTGILGYCSVLLIRLPQGSPLRAFATAIAAAAKRAADLVQGLLTFARRQPLNLRPADLNALVSGNRDFMSRVIGAATEIRMELCGDTLPVLVDSVQMEQVLLNLSTNARDAMPQGGVITVRTSGDGEEATQPSAYLFFEDTGVGMEPETMTRVFEPFFTTKDVGKGTGLGLSVVWSIVEQNGGRVSVESTVGRGTTIIIAFPLFRTRAGDAGQGSYVVAGTETVLVVDDDDGVRDLTRAVLEGLGYTVLVAEGYDAAMTVFSANRDRISLAVVDVVLPKRDGLRLLAEMRERSPSLKGLLMSGYAGTAAAGARTGRTEDGLLRKPFAPLDLATRVREILDG